MYSIWLFFLFAGRPKGSKNSPGKGRKQKVKDPNKPKRPTSAYFYFVAAQRLKNEKEGKKISRVAEWTKEVSKIWGKLEKHEKKPFEVKAAADKARYEQQVQRQYFKL